MKCGRSIKMTPKQIRDFNKKYRELTKDEYTTKKKGIIKYKKTYKKKD